jgi:hypothetical protein
MSVTSNQLPIVEARMLKGPVGNGITEPYHIMCNDGPFVVKFAQNPQGPRSLVNEYVCAKLALGLDLPLPDARLVRVTESFLKENPELKEIGIETGLHFGSRKIKKSAPVTSSAVLKRSINCNIVPDILIYDHWINNDDRKSNTGNLLIETITKELHIIDHTHAFEIGSLWDDHQLNLRIGQDIVAFDMSGSVYSHFRNCITGNNPFFSIMNKINKLSYDDLINALVGLPDDWSCSIIEKKALQEYLMDRKIRMPEVLPQLKKYLPYWKGGDQDAQKIV